MIYHLRKVALPVAASAVVLAAVVSLQSVSAPVAESIAAAPAVDRTDEATANRGSARTDVDTPPITAAPVTTAAPTTTTRPAAKTSGNVQSGKASYYDYKVGGCAHKTLPKGTVITVTNLSNGKSTTCVVNDRGPYIAGRIIDLDTRVFKQVASTSSGVFNARISW